MAQKIHVMVATAAAAPLEKFKSIISLSKLCVLWFQGLFLSRFVVMFVCCFIHPDLQDVSCQIIVSWLIFSSNMFGDIKQAVYATVASGSGSFIRSFVSVLQYYFVNVIICMQISPEAQCPATINFTILFSDSK